MPHLARQAISNGAQMLRVLLMDLDMTHTESIFTLTCIKIRMLLVGSLNDLKPQSRCTVNKRLPIPDLINTFKTNFRLSFSMVTFFKS